MNITEDSNGVGDDYNESAGFNSGQKSSAGASSGGIITGLRQGNRQQKQLRNKQHGTVDDFVAKNNSIDGEYLPSIRTPSTKRAL